MTSTAPQLSREGRTALLGLDCADCLEWCSWSPGGEYLKVRTRACTAVHFRAMMTLFRVMWRQFVTRDLIRGFLSKEGQLPLPADDFGRCPLSYLY